MRKALFGVFLTMIMVSGVVLGGPLKKEHVRGDAQWLFHADFDALRTSEFGKLIQNDIQAKYQDKIEALKQLLGSDLTEDLRAITLYGAEAGEENVSALFYGNYNKEKLLTLLVLNKAYSKSEYNGKTLHHWMDEKHERQQYGAFAADDLIVIGQTEASVTSVLDVLFGKARPLSQQKDGTIYSLCQGHEGAIVMIVAEGLSELTQNNHHTAILKNSHLMAALAAEKDGHATLDVHLEAQTEEAAVQIEQVVRGMTAFAMLQHEKYPELSELVQATTLLREGKTLDCTFKYPSAKLFEIIKDHAEDIKIAPIDELEMK